MHGTMGFGTKAIHAGKEEKNAFGALTAPIFQTSTFEFDSCRQGGDRFAGKEEGMIYTRLGNPTTALLERKLAALENAEAAVVMASGMGAISSVLWSACKAGDHIVADGTLYGCTHALLAHGMTRYGVEVDFINTSDLDALQAALKPNTSVVYLETPANPNLKIADLAEVSRLAHAYNPAIKVIADNTFATPYCQRPLDLGCDVVVHSMTKYLNGHGDIIAGFVCCDSKYYPAVLTNGLKNITGSVPAPLNAFLLNRGLKTLPLRMKAHCENAMKVAKWLEENKDIEAVYYPGLKSHPQYKIAKKELAMTGGMIAFEPKTAKIAEKMMNNVKLCTLAVSLGDCETLIEHPGSMTHSTYTEEEMIDAGFNKKLIRLSVGLEDPDDIIADLDQALKAALKK